MIHSPIPKVRRVVCAGGGVLSLEFLVQAGLSWGYSHELSENFKKGQGGLKENISSLPLPLTTNQLGVANRTVLEPWG